MALLTGTLVKDVLTRLPTQLNSQIEQLLPHLARKPVHLKMPRPDAYAPAAQGLCWLMGGETSCAAFG
jgi:hypothetical protein